jgi:glutamine cyclotransferase
LLALAVLSLAGCGGPVVAIGVPFNGASSPSIVTAAPSSISSPTPSPTGAPATDDFTIIAQYPHDTGAWTEGLAFLGDQLYESTGRLGQSSLRHVDLESGSVLQQHELSASDYGEGLTFLDGKAWVLTWTQQHVLLFDPQTFDSEGEYRYEIQGWGLTTDGTNLYMSDGTNRITERSPTDFRVIRWLDVADGDQPVARLNELEWIDGRIWANVWLTPYVVVIDPTNGQVLERIDFSRLIEFEASQGGQPAEMNGIAWVPSERRLFVTGKLWGNLYEVRV